MRTKLRILLIILITISCIFLGIQTRKSKAIDITQIKTVSNESLSYMIETTQHNIIMIDGGNNEDAEYLEQVLTQKGGIVDRWYITLPRKENFGALEKIIENGNIEIRNIYVSLNSNEWYEKNDKENYEDIIEFSNLLYDGNLKDRVLDVPNKYELIIDNIYISVLNVKNPELQNIYDQSMIIKVDNTYKSMIFMGNASDKAVNEFEKNCQDELDCDAVQFSNNMTQNLKDELYQIMTPEQIYVASNENQNIKIW